MKTETYNGYSNYPTWIYATWLGNDAYMYGLLKKLKADAVDVYDLALGLEALLTQDEFSHDGLPGVLKDLLTSAIGLIDYSEIAKNFFAD